MQNYDGGVVADQATGRPLVGRNVKVYDEETDAPVQVYREGVPVNLVSGAHGLIPQFQTEDSTRRVRMEVGPVRLRQWSQEMVDAAADASGSISSALEQVEVARSEAAAIVPRMEGIEAMAGLAPEGVTDGQTSNLIAQEGSLTRDALNAASAEVAKDTLATQTFTGTGTGDQVAFASAVGSLSSGETLLVRGTVALSSTVTLATPDTGLRFAPGAKITTTVSAADVLAVTAAGVSIEGGTIESPAVFNGENAAPGYAVVRIKADDVRVAGLRLVNVPKVGIYFDDVQTGTVEGCRIVGNYPAASWTGVETGHFGIAVNPGGSAAGRMIITGNHLRSCVQGVFIGNYGVPATAYGTVINGNIFDGCHNHGVYNAGGLDACSVTGNTFTRCSMPVALTGAGHAISGNTMHTHSSGNNLDVAGISIREAVGCTIAGNSISGDVLNSQVVIELGNYVAGSTALRGNTITGNTIRLGAGAGVAIRVGRLNQTTTCNDNIVANNVIEGNGQSGVGLITIAPGVSSSSHGNKVTGNTIVAKAASHGVYVANANHTTITDNTVRFEHNAGSSTVVAGVQLSAVRGSLVRNNSFMVPSGSGTNLTIRAVWETTGCANNKFGPNAHDSANATTYVPMVTGSGTNCFVDESGTGDPNGAFFASAGSRWARTDGGALTSLYVKESGSSAANGWVGK
ncbi:right-handed parallel beta-helix repeat-containing protein [Micrococcus terreus]|uniref:NosD domain-containing protein n=1 Tax=Micrococcus terreus TaxID=574650 RepID=UPI0033C08751